MIRMETRKAEGKGWDEDRVKKKIDDIRNAEVKKLVFDDALRQTNNDKQNQMMIMSFLG